MKLTSFAKYFPVTEDQEKLFDIIFDAYKAEEPENLQLLEESIQRTKDNFTKAHISWT